MIRSRLARPSATDVRAQAQSTGAAPESSRFWSREWIYVTVMMAAWCFTPLVRRLLDWHNGFYNPIQIASTIPFLLTIPLALVCFRKERIARLTPFFKLLAWVWVGTFAYGFIVAAFLGNLFAAAYELVQYLIPMLIAIWIAGQELDTTLLVRRLTKIVLSLGAVVAAYGLYQFVQPPPWDVLWIVGGQFTAMGSPTPFAMRVFATLNSSGPAADFFALGIILSLPLVALKRLWIWPLLTILGAALLLTLVRTSWIGLVVGTIVYLIGSPLRFRAVPFLAVFAVVLSLLVSVLPAVLGAGGDSDVVMSRISTLGDVNHDGSALARTQEIEESLRSGIANPLGVGLGMIGASSALSANPTSQAGNNLDSGYMARFLELGWLGFFGYIFVVFGSFAALMKRVLQPVRGSQGAFDGRVIAATAAGMCFALLWADAAGDSHLGLDGLFFWIAIGIGLRRSAVETGTRGITLRKRVAIDSKSQDLVTA